VTDISFIDQVAIVTGAGGGLGRTYALELAARGASVVVNDLGGSASGVGSDASAAQKVVEEITAKGGSAVASHDSVSTPEGGQAIVDAAVEAFGRVDIVINNAGILRDKTFAKLAVEDLEAVLDVHLKGAFFVSQPAFRVMKEQGYGRFVFTASNAGVFGNFGQTNYGAAKMGLVGAVQRAGDRGCEGQHQEQRDLPDRADPDDRGAARSVGGERRAGAGHADGGLPGQLGVRVDA